MRTEYVPILVRAMFVVLLVLSVGTAMACHALVTGPNCGPSSPFSEGSLDCSHDFGMEHVQCQVQGGRWITTSVSTYTCNHVAETGWQGCTDNDHKVHPQKQEYCCDYNGTCSTSPCGDPVDNTQWECWTAAAVGPACPG